ncbi:hypothetical protein [Paludibacterium denitrificans]|uniref:hypothetical protein n=1 Tax=Paludibacterium denitrificans TaxID=2675226 RepID=UPI0028B1ABCA|nr:hypothetical protein [Paludibacterium denitrificans]
MLANYLDPSRDQLALKKDIFERLAAYRPYPNLLTKLAVIQALDGQPALARQNIVLLLASYPDAAPVTYAMLQRRPEPEVQPLAELAKTAAEAYLKAGANTDA